MKIKVGTRGSDLAVTQTKFVIEQLKRFNKDLEAEIVIIKTKGDKIQNVSLDKIGDKGLFVKEIEEQLLAGNIDIAIHSMKDMPGEWTDGLMLLPVTERKDPRDVLVTRHKVNSLEELPESLIVATGSKRRSSQLLDLWPNVDIRPIRGNVPTRIQKMLDNGFDGTVLAAAGVERLGIKSNDEYSVVPFEVHEMIPAPAQGVLGLQLRIDDDKVKGIVEPIISKSTMIQNEYERLFLQTLNGSCHLPMGAYFDNETNKFYGLYGDEACNKVIRKVITLNENAKEQIISLAKEMIKEVE